MESHVSLVPLVIVLAAAFVSPFLLGLVPRVPVPSVVLEIGIGILVGPSILGWVEVDATLQVLSFVGLAFLLFVSGAEVDLDGLRGRAALLPLGGFAISLVIGAGVGGVLAATGRVDAPLLVAIALVSTALGIVVPVLKDAGAADRPVGELVVGASTVADVGAVVLLTLFFSGTEGGAAGTVMLFGLFVGVIVAVGLSLGRLGRIMALSAEFTRLDDTTAQLRVRGAVLLMAGFVALASRLGLETILGAFLAGIVLGRLDRLKGSHAHFRIKLEGIAFGFVVPVFFVLSGVQFNLRALASGPATLAMVPVLLAALLASRGLPALLYRRRLAAPHTIAAALLQATSLPIVVTTAMIGTSLGVVDESIAAAMVGAGLLSVVLFPPIAVTLLRRAPRPLAQTAASDRSRA